MWPIVFTQIYSVVINLLLESCWKNNCSQRKSLKVVAVQSVKYQNTCSCWNGSKPNPNLEYSGTQLQGSKTHINGLIIIILYNKLNYTHILMVLSSKCGKHICGTLDSSSYATFLLFAHFDVNYELLLNRHTTTQNLLIRIRRISMYSCIHL